MFQVKYETYQRTWFRDFLSEQQAIISASKLMTKAHEKMSLTVTTNGRVVREFHKAV